MNINKIKINFKELASNTLNIDKARPRQRKEMGKIVVRPVLLAIWDLGPLQLLEYRVEIQPELKSSLS